MVKTFETTKMILLTMGIAVALPVAGQAASHGERIDFETLDTDGDGQVTQEEMQALAASRFAVADSNNDGVLSTEELMARFEGRMQERMERRVARMIEARDDNGDGVLSAEELAPNEDRMARRFDRLDTNSDGSISQEEFETAQNERRGGMRRGKKNHGDDN
ncbi:MAG: calcium-binding protein [Pseudomonadota bacterium]